jgi:tRNA (uracil-5-)-methyltransferase TRM9
MEREIAKKIIDKTREDYKKISKEFIQTRAYPWPIFNKFKDYVNSGNRILDVGCGTGRLIEVFRDMDIDYVGFDINEEEIEFARNKYSSFLTSSPTFIAHDIIDFPWPFQKESFDVLFMVAVYHHIPSKELRQEVLKEISRVLKSNGKLIMTNWNLRSIWAIRKFWPEILRLYFPRKDFERGDFLAPWKMKSGEKIFRFYHSFSLQELKKELEKANFTILENYYTINGEKSNLLFGKNIFTVAEKR